MIIADPSFSIFESITSKISIYSDDPHNCIVIHSIDQHLYSDLRFFAYKLFAFTSILQLFCFILVAMDSNVSHLAYMRFMDIEIYENDDLAVYHFYKVVLKKKLFELPFTSANYSVELSSSYYTLQFIV
jgi:hypothetical protein